MIRIAVTGPESSGKTSLCKALAQHYGVNYIPEFARAYLENTDGKYTQSDLDHIAKGQLDAIKSASGKLIISDTDFHVIEIWSMYKYDEVSDYISTLAQENLFDLHILCTPDVPWEPDPLRENPHDRDDLFQNYKSAFEKHKKQFIIVAGAEEKRIKKSIEMIDSIHNK